MADDNPEIDNSRVQHTRQHDFRGGILKNGNEINDGEDSYTDENAQDAIGTILTSDFTYNDSAPSIDLSFDPATQTELNNHTGTSDAHHTKTQPSDVDSTNWDDYEIQKDGTDGTGIINFKTA